MGLNGKRLKKVGKSVVKGFKTTGRGISKAYKASKPYVKSAYKDIKTTGKVIARDIRKPKINKKRKKFVKKLQRMSYAFDEAAFGI